MKTDGKHIYFPALCIFLAVICGCGEFFEKKTTELESKGVLREISRVPENPHVGNPLPQVYLNGPKRLHVEDGVELFYFTKYTPVGDPTYTNKKDQSMEKRVRGLAGTIQQLGFKVSAHPSTNQLIIHCADDAECDQVLAYLEKTDVPPIQVHIDCLILERFGDVTKDWETTLLIENLLGEKVTLGEGKYPNPAFPGASLRESKRSDFGLDFGYSGNQVRAVVDALVSRGYLKILMNPTLETVNGKAAKVEISDFDPISKTVTQKGVDPYSVTDYKWVGDSLSVTPYVYSDGYIGLKTNIVLGSKSKPEGVVQTSIITERSIDIAENRIEPGKSLVIGGMRKAEDRSVIRGVPFFKDIPLLGILFSSKDYEENADEIIFILTPSISSGGAPYKKTADDIRKKFATPQPSTDWDEIVTDPLGTKAYLDVVGEKANLTEAEKVRLQVQTNEVRRQARAAQLRANRATAEAKALRARAQEAEAQLQKAEAQKKAAEAQQTAAQKEAAAQRAVITQTTEDIEKARAEAASAHAEAEKAQAALKEAEQKVQTLNEQEKAALEQVHSIQEQIDALEKQPQPDSKAAPETQPQPESKPEPSS